jgi:hypothetical protein
VRHSTYQRPPRRRRFPWGVLVGFGLFLALALAVGAWVVAYKNSERTVTFTVEDKERVCSGSTDGQSSCKYLIFTDTGTYSVQDSFIIWRFNSSDVYGRIKESQTYEADVIGWRIPFLSKYPNIVETRSE